MFPHHLQGSSHWIERLELDLLKLKLKVQENFSLDQDGLKWLALDRGFSDLSRLMDLELRSCRVKYAILKLIYIYDIKVYLAKCVGRTDPYPRKS